MTYQQCAATEAQALEAAGIAADTGRTDVSVLARFVLGWDTARWLAERHGNAPPGFSAALAALVGRRARHEPIAYILGSREFFGRPFLVTPDVLIPRPDTETVVEAALKSLRPPGANAPLVVDVGTGCGCIAITLAAERPDIRVVATDVAPAALVVASENAVRHGVSGRVTFRTTSLVDGLAVRPDLIVSNPPYVRNDERPAMPREVLAYEPHGALFAGDEGLDVIRPLIDASARMLSIGGRLVLEIGNTQADPVRRLVDAAPGLEFVTVVADIESRPRAVVAVRT